MVLGLIDFLLGGKKKTNVPKNGQVATPSQGNQQEGNGDQNGAEVPDGQNTTTQNANQQSGGKKSVSEALQKLNDEVKETNQKITDINTSVQKLEGSVNSLGHRVDNLEEGRKQDTDKVGEMEEQMSKFLSLYELINNQYNPFVSKSEEQQQAKKIVLNNEGGSQSESTEGESNEEEGEGKAEEGVEKPGSLKEAIPELKEEKATTQNSNEDLEDSLVELDTLDIEEAAGNAVPLRKLKNNTNSLVIILSWLEYLIKKVGIEETRNTLKYYTEVLRWITPEVYFDLDKYLRGMKDKQNHDENTTLSVRDHIVSLYFISKLNEKTLDKKLTRAVLKMIKQ